MMRMMKEKMVGGSKALYQKVLTLRQSSSYPVDLMNTSSALQLMPLTTTTLLLNPLRRAYFQHYQRRLQLRHLAAVATKDAIQDDYDLAVRMGNSEDARELQSWLIDQGDRMEAIKDELKRVESILSENYENN